MDNFSYTDNARAALASCLPCFVGSRSKPISNPSVGATLSDPHSTTTGYPSSTNDLEHLLRDSDSDALSLHSHLGVAARRRAKHRRRQPKFSLTLFGYTLFGRQPIYLSEDDDDGDDSSGRRARTSVTASSSTLDSDAAPLDASTIERMTSPDHFAALAAQRQQLQAAEAARRKAERRARREERKARARAEALMSVTSGSPRTDTDTFEGFQGSGDGVTSVPLPPHRAAPSIVSGRLDPDGLGADGYVGGSHSGDADDADLGGELYTRKKSPSAALSVSGSDSRSRTSASFSAGDASHVQTFPIHTTHQSVPYPQTEMRLPTPTRKKPHRTSTVSSATSQSTSTAPYTPVESLMEAPAVAAFPVPQERYLRDGQRTDFPSVGLPGKRGISSLDPKTFLAHQG